MISCDCGGGEFDITQTRELADGSRVRHLKCWKCNSTTKQIVPAEIWARFFRTRLSTQASTLSPST